MVESVELDYDKQKAKLAFPDWNVGPNYIVDKILGSGSYGSVCRALQVSSG